MKSVTYVRLTESDLIVWFASRSVHAGLKSPCIVI